MKIAEEQRRSTTTLVAELQTLEVGAWPSQLKPKPNPELERQIDRASS
jgi:hypothetical protein